MSDQEQPRKQDNARLVRKLLWVTLGAFLFCFSLVPLYRIACEKVLGIKLKDGAVDAAVAADFDVDSARWVEVQFDASVNSGLPWVFSPRQNSVKVHPGEATEVWFTAVNTSAQILVGQAVPSIAPNTASMYFNKTECFCFTQQLLKAGESREMPVRFIVDPKLPDSVHVLTLSYTFFLNDIATRAVAQDPPAVTPAT
jgi:cytochrome c oxidase assembly protein subunit 11